MFKEQLSRIKSKLTKALEVDSKFKVFGATSHKYVVNPPIPCLELESFELKYGVKLPQDYREFLLEIGNGGAGPFHGLYPLGEGIDELSAKSETVSLPACVRPDMTDEEWRERSKKIVDDEGISDEDYDSESSVLYSGILPIGSQGCTYLHALVLTGEYAGKVMNVDMDFHKPKFCYEQNFLDWYERWLDEVISGILLADGPTWFGYSKGGGDIDLLNFFDSVDDLSSKKDALLGLQKLPSINECSCDRLKLICDSEIGELRELAIHMLVKFSYKKSVMILEELVSGSDEECKLACQAIYWYQKEYSAKWSSQIMDRISTVKNSETFSFMLYILKEAKFDYGDLLIPFYSHESEEMRVTSYYSLGLLKTKSKYRSIFVLGLKDKSPRVVHTTLQALPDERNPLLFEEFVGIIRRFKTDEHYILTNLNQILRNWGYKDQTEFINYFKLQMYRESKAENNPKNEDSSLAWKQVVAENSQKNFLQKIFAFFR